MNKLKKAQFPIKYRRDIRTGSPRKLWRTLHDFLTDNGYEHKYEELKPQPSAIEGTAIFSGTLDGWRDGKKPARWWFWIIGLLLCFTIVFIWPGSKLMKARMLRTRITIGIEGEAYRARGAGASDGHAAEVLDVVADTRVTLEAGAGKPKKDSKDNKHEIEELTKDERDIAKLSREFEELKRQLDELLPEISLPSIKGQEG